MDIINDTPITRWFARLFLLFIIITIVWYIFYRKATYKDFIYNGIKKYHYNPLGSSVKSVANFFTEKKKKRVNKTEEQCRKIIQKIYNKPFPSIRPNFLKSPMTNKNLELDCYNEDLRIALEYNGQQHYKYTPHFHKTKTNFYSQVHRDDWKRNTCRKLDIKLIEIPYWIQPIDLKEYIINELKKKGCL